MASSGAGGSKGNEVGSSGDEGSVSVAAPPKAKVNKNAPGMRTDISWSNGVSIDGDARKIKCKYGEKLVTRGVYRLTHQLAGTQKDVGACRAVPDDGHKQMWGIVSSLQENLNKKSNTNEHEGGSSNAANVESVDEAGKRRRQEEIQTPANLFKKRGVSSQPTINNIFKKSLRDGAYQEVALFFYNNAIPFNVANSEEFKKMCELIARHGQGFKPPSYHEIRVKYLKQQVEKTNQTLEEHRVWWKKSGCTIMTDGWTDSKKRTILNFLVNSPKGTVFLKSIDASDICKTTDKIFKMMDDVVEEVGEENVVQIVVTDNAANYKAAGDLLIEKRKKLYWTPCAAHCINLILEDFEKKIPLHRDTIASGKRITTYIYSRTGVISLLHQFTKGIDLIRPAMTRFVTSYLTLGCLNDNKGALIRMFTSKEWKSSKFAKTKDGVFVENVITDKGFWKNILNCLRGAYPLIKVLRLVDSDEKPAMGFIYEEMDRAKERIQSAFIGVSRCYTPLWEIIDQRWDNQLHRPLHAAGYYLNPIFHYSPEFKVDYKVKRGLYKCLERMVGDIDEISKIDIQLEDFKSRSKFFGSAIATRALKTKTPAQWWESYGDEHPELQKFAIRVLSLTCSSLGCEHNWSAFEMVHTKKRNRLKQKTMNDVVFVMANSRLAKRKQVRKEIEYNIDDLSSDDDWIVENDQNSDVDLDAPLEDDSVQVGGDASGRGSAPVDDLDVPNVVVDDDDGDAIDEGEDHMEDDYPKWGLKDLLG